MNDEQNNLRIARLGPGDIDSVMALQTVVLDSLGADRYFLKPRAHSDWLAILDNDDYAVFGVFNREKLIAMGTVHFPNGFDPRDIPEFTPVPDEELAVFQAVMVHSDYRGMGLMRMMQECRQAEAIRRHRYKVICKMSVRNINSWKNTLDFGFHGVRVGSDETGHEKMYFIKKLQPNQVFFAK
jgi:GNAT superfamily N-acetyltransferase